MHWYLHVIRRLVSIVMCLIDDLDLLRRALILVEVDATATWLDAVAVDGRISSRLIMVFQAVACDRGSRRLGSGVDRTFVSLKVMGLQFRLKG